jgi:Circularly permutated YpsA SLOG family
MGETANGRMGEWANGRMGDAARMPYQFPRRTIELIDAKYPLKETPSAAYVQRTEWNVRDSDATVLLSMNRLLSGGSKKTLEFARRAANFARAFAFCFHDWGAGLAPGILIDLVGPNRPAHKKSGHYRQV